MKTSDTFQKYSQNKNIKERDFFDPTVILALIFKNWYFFIIGISISLFIARFWARHTLPLYRTSLTLLINETKDRQIADNSAILQGLGLPGGMDNIENQINIITSISLIDKTLSELPFRTEYYFKTIRNKLPIYPEVPVEVKFEGDIPFPKDIEFSIRFLEGNNFIFKSENEKDFMFEETSAFGRAIKVNNGIFSIELINSEWLKTNKDKILYFTIHSQPKLIRNFHGRLNIDKVNKESSILRISLDGTNMEKDADFLNSHILNYQQISLNKKNEEAERRIRFIDDQLVGVSDSLITTEARLQKFRSTHRVMDLSVQGQALIGQVTLLENERARLELEANYYDYLADYLSKDVSGELPIVPVTMGITDPGLTRLVEELSTLQGQLSTTGAGEMNPLQKSLLQRINSSKEALRETLNGLRRANSLARTENQDRINKVNSQASTLPVTERQLLGIERKFRLNDELYTFLLEARAEQQMQKASNVADCEIIDPANKLFSVLISPNLPQTYAIGFSAGFILPFLIILSFSIFDNKLKDEEIVELTKIPVIGKIPNNTEKSTKIVFDFPNSTSSESFRLFRSRMQFFIKNATAPVMIVTSSMPAEGKTYTAINLASVYSLLGKRTILIDFDLRKPKISSEFGLNNESGVSTWLIGQDNLQNIIQETSHKNLCVITAGPIPPNPSELTALNKTEELIILLREQFEYIVIDTAPIGVVSDTYHLISLADVCLLVVRHKYTLRSMFESTINEINNRGVKELGLVINGTKSSLDKYNYAEKYKYTENRKKSTKKII